MLGFKLLGRGHFCPFSQMRVLKRKNRNTTCEQVHIVEPFFEYYICVLRSMAFVFGVNNDQFVGSVFELSELTKNLVTLDVNSRKTNSIFYVPLLIVFYWSKIEQQDFWSVSFIYRHLWWKFSRSHDFLVKQKTVRASVMRLTSLQESGQRRRSHSREKFAPEFANNFLTVCVIV